MGKISSLITSKTWSTKRLTSEGTSEENYRTGKSMIWSDFSVREAYY